MSGQNVDRRGFLKKASALTATAAAAFGFEEQALLAYQQGRGPGGPPQGAPAGAPPAAGRGPAQAAPLTSPGPMPKFKLTPTLEVTRLIAGHNLVVFQAHSRDLIYVSQLLRAYFTPQKIDETFAKYEEVGINSSLMRVQADMMERAKAHKARGGKIQWFAQLAPNEKDLKRDIDLAMNTVGCSAAYIRGLEGDSFYKNGKLEMLGQLIEYVHSQYKIPIGLGTHSLDPLIAAEKMGGLGADYYMKTFNAGSYWSAGAPLTPDPNWKPSATELVQPEFGDGNHDNLWEATPKATTEWLKGIKKPILAYKVLAAGAIRPKDGFSWALNNGADFMAVGMYDFQCAEDAEVTKAYFKDGNPKRARPWPSA